MSRSDRIKKVITISVLPSLFWLLCDMNNFAMAARVNALEREALKGKVKVPAKSLHRAMKSLPSELGSIRGLVEEIGERSGKGYPVARRLSALELKRRRLDGMCPPSRNNCRLKARKG